MLIWTTGSSGHSKAAEMQELLRRLCERCARLEIEMTLTHQPGAKLDRPDQVSRGTAVEEPRVRLNAGLYSALARGLGPFTEFLGAEREHSTPRGRLITGAPRAPRDAVLRAPVLCYSWISTSIGGRCAEAQWDEYLLVRGEHGPEARRRPRGAAGRARVG